MSAASIPSDRRNWNSLRTPLFRALWTPHRRRLIVVDLVPGEPGRSLSRGGGVRFERGPRYRSFPVLRARVDDACGLPRGATRPVTRHAQQGSRGGPSAALLRLVSRNTADPGIPDRQTTEVRHLQLKAVSRGTSTASSNWRWTLRRPPRRRAAPRLRTIYSAWSSRWKCWASRSRVNSWRSLQALFWLANMPFSQ